MRTLLSFFPAVLLLVSLLASVFLLWPKYQQLMYMRQIIEKHEERVRQGEELLVRLRDQKREAEARSESFRKIDKAIPADNALPAVLYEIQKMAVESGLVFRGFDSKEQVVAKGVVQARQTTLSLHVEGNYEGLKSFLARLRTSERILNTRSVALRVQQQENADDILVFDLQVGVYAL